MKSFNTSAPQRFKWDGGYSGGTINASDIATKLFRGTIPGAMLCCYMLRRFGWPNAGSDEYKNLMEWDLTTPIKGLYLSVCPYLGDRGNEPYNPKQNYQCTNLHFGIRFTKVVGRKIDFDPGREHWFKRHSQFIARWWKRVGIKLYCWGHGDAVGDRDELVKKYRDDQKHKGKVFGLWKRTKEMTRIGDLPKTLNLEWWLEELIEENHPEVAPPKMTQREKMMRSNPFRRTCERAIQRTILDLLRPTNVRDISFTPFGDIEREPEAIKRFKGQKSVEYFIGAGYTPEYWFKHASKKERNGLP